MGDELVAVKGDVFVELSTGRVHVFLHWEEDLAVLEQPEMEDWDKPLKSWIPRWMLTERFEHHPAERSR